jgi:hypothetical protein
VNVPIPDSYWVEPGRLLAGEYPGARTDEGALPRLEAFAGAGITSFVDLTEADEELSPYDGLLAPGVRYRRVPVRDLGCPLPRPSRLEWRAGAGADRRATGDGAGGGVARLARDGAAERARARLGRAGDSVDLPPLAVAR